MSISGHLRAARARAHLRRGRIAGRVLRWMGWAAVAVGVGVAGAVLIGGGP